MTDMRTVFSDAASALLDEDPLAAVVLAEISADLFAKAAARHPERVLNVGIREQLMVSVGGGLALAGLRPIVHTYAPFLVERAFEQVKLDLAHQGARAVLVSIGASYDAASSGRTHQAPEDVALVDTVPGFSVVVPGHPDEVPELLRSAVGALDSRSTYVRLSSKANRSALPVWPGLQVVRSGREAVVVAVGPMLSPVLDAVGDLDVTVAYTTSVRPFDGEGLRALCLVHRWCWSSLIWRGRLRIWRPPRWRGGRTGCSAWAWGVPSCGGTGRLPTTRRCTGRMRRGSGVLSWTS
jgi:transketolase